MTLEENVAVVVCAIIGHRWIPVSWLTCNNANQHQRVCGRCYAEPKRIRP